MAEDAFPDPRGGSSCSAVAEEVVIDTGESSSCSAVAEDHVDILPDGIRLWFIRCDLIN